MKINNITLKGYGSFLEETTVNISEGIIGIIGIHDDNERKSNAAGKTTLISAINYALFGEGEFDKLENLVCDNSPDGEMFVKIEFDLNANNYTVERGITKGSSYLEFTENGVRRKQEDGSSTKKSSIGDITKDIIKVFGMDYDMFTASVFFEQGGMDKFINADPAVVRQYIDKVLGLEVWRSSSKDIVKKIKQCKESLGTNVEYLNGLRDSLNQLEQRLSEKPVIESKLIIQQELLKNKEEEQKVISNIHVLLKQKAVLVENSKTVDTSIISVDVLLVDTASKHERCVIELKENTEFLNSNELDKLETIDSSLEKTEIEKNDLKAVIEDLNTRTLNLSSLLSSAQTTITMNKKLRDKFKSGICGECEQVVSTDYVSDKQKQYDDIITNAINILSGYKKEQSDVDVRFSQVRPRIANLEFEIKTLRQEKSELVSRKHAIELAITNLGQEQIGYENLIKQTEESKQKLLNQKLSLKLQIHDIDKQIPENANERLNLLQQEIVGIKNTIDSLNRSLGGLEQLNVNKKLTESNIQEYENSIKELEESIDIHNVLAEAFRDIPKQIFDKSVIAIQETANSIIQQVISELSVHIYEDDSKLKRLIIAFEVNGKERRYKRLSGGQKTVANIGLRLGFSQVIKRRANTNIELVVLDEPFGALDEENRDLVKTVLAAVQEWFKQIIVISHVGGVETFPNVITVRYSPERGSYI